MNETELSDIEDIAENIEIENIDNARVMYSVNTSNRFKALERLEYDDILPKGSYVSIVDILRSNGFNSDSILHLGRMLDSIRGINVEFALFVILILNRHFQIDFDLNDLDDLSDKELKSHKERVTKQVKDERTKKAVVDNKLKNMIKIGTEKVCAVKYLDGILTAKLTPAGIKNARIAQYQLRVEKRAKAFESITECLAWRYTTRQNKFTQDVVERVIAERGNTASAFERLSGNYYLGKINTEQYVLGLHGVDYHHSMAQIARYVKMKLETIKEREPQETNNEFY